MASVQWFWSAPRTWRGAARVASVVVNARRRSAPGTLLRRSHASGLPRRSTGKGAGLWMDLEPVYAGAEPSQSAAMGAGSVRLTPDQEQAARMQTETVEAAPAARTLRTAGRVAPDEGRTYRVSAGSDGWVRRVFSDQTGSQVKRGAGTGGLLQQGRLGATAGLRLRAGILRTAEDNRPRARRTRAGTQQLATRAITCSSSAWARRRSRNSPHPPRDLRRQSHGARRRPDSGAPRGGGPAVHEGRIALPHRRPRARLGSGRCLPRAGCRYWADREGPNHVDGPAAHGGGVAPRRSAIRRQGRPESCGWK